MRQFLLLLSVFINGAAVLAVEIIGARLIGPYFGTTIFVWSSLITVTLGGLTTGYFIGGSLSKRERWNYPFFWGATALGGTFLVLIPFFVTPVVLSTESIGLRFGPLVSAFILFFPFFFLEGLLAPLALHIRARERHTGMTAGTLYGISTIGSLAGALAAGFFLVPILSLSSTFHAIGVILFVLGLVGLLSSRTNNRLMSLWFIILSFFAAGIAMLNPTSKPMSTSQITVLDKKETFYSSLTVVEKGDFRCLLSDALTHTCIDKKTGTMEGFSILKNAINPYLIELKPPQRVLIVGSGAGGYLKAIPRGVHATLVEIDPMTIEFGRKYFGLELSGLDYTLLIDDARHAVRRLARELKTYDLVLIDVFSGASIPSHILTKEAFIELARIVTPNGAVILNGGVATRQPSSGDRYVSSIINSAGTIFANTAAFWGNEPRESNIIFFFSPKIAPKISLPTIEAGPQTTLLMDDFNPIEYYGLERNLLVIENLRKIFPPVFFR